ncbi:hypothetical protein BLOT_010817 [Blomia tropicalis]|nr:hypothetical protein BLOT_010817 [Blomia tropicalis]
MTCPHGKYAYLPFLSLALADERTIGTTITTTTSPSNDRCVASETSTESSSENYHQTNQLRKKMKTSDIVE